MVLCGQWLVNFLSPLDRGGRKYDKALLVTVRLSEALLILLIVVLFDDLPQILRLTQVVNTDVQEGQMYIIVLWRVWTAKLLLENV